MNEQLLSRLIERGYFTNGVMVRTSIRKMDISGVEINSFDHDFIVTHMGRSKKTGEIILTLRSKDTSDRLRIKSSDIQSIDGMDPERFGNNYLLDNQGNDLKPVGRRRGRKPQDYDQEVDIFYA